MAYTNSSLVSYTRISPNKTSPRSHAIDTITIHCVVGQCSVEALGSVFAPTSRKASSNYGVGYDGRIGMYVEEKDRSWCSSNYINDNRAITIEVASDTTYPYAVTDKALASLIELVADICKRNNIKELKWKGDKSLVGQVDKQNMTVHRWFAATACPGDYLYKKHSYIADEVNKRLNAKQPTSAYSPSINTLVKNGVINSPDYWKNQLGNLKYLNDLIDKIANNVQSNKINSFSDVKKAINHLVETGVINSPDYWVTNYSKIKYLDDLLINAANHIKSNNIKSKLPYKVQVTVDSLNIRKGAGTNYDTRGVIKGRGVYTIVDEETNGSTKWGLLKSYKNGRNGWISLKYTKRI